MQNFAGNIPVDIVVLGLIAAFLVLRLRSILGKRTGLERPDMPPPGGLRPTGGPFARTPGARQGPTIDTRAEPTPPPTDRRLPDPSSPAGLTLARIRDRERGFEPIAFLTQAEASFRRIVQAFAEGDRGALRQCLTADAFTAFDSAITAREQAGETQRSEIRAITTTQITDGSLVEENGTWRASLEVRFVSDQVSVLLGRDGLPVTGADAVTELADIWTFERWIGGPKQEAGAAPWRLAVARSA